MRVTVTMVHAVAARGGAADGTRPLDLADGTTAADVAGVLDLARDEDYAVIVNGRAVPPERRAAHALHDGDTVVILPPLEGG